MTEERDTTDRPRYRISADRHSAKRRVRYVESNHPDDGQCTICQLDELTDVEQQNQQPDASPDASGSTPPQND